LTAFPVSLVRDQVYELGATLLAIRRASTAPANDNSEKLSISAKTKFLGLKDSVFFGVLDVEINCTKLAP